MRILFALLIVMTTVATACSDAPPQELRQKIGDSAPSDRWIYDDWDQGKQTAEEAKKPALVVFRCVP